MKTRIKNLFKIGWEIIKSIYVIAILAAITPFIAIYVFGLMTWEQVIKKFKKNEKIDIQIKTRWKDR
jgi:hypothetical protein